MVKVPTIDQWQDLFSRIKESSGALGAWPAGSYYLTSDLNFDPNESWGGTWERQDGGIGGGGEYWSTYGEVWDAIGGVFRVNETIVNRWHRLG